MPEPTPRRKAVKPSKAVKTASTSRKPAKKAARKVVKKAPPKQNVVVVGGGQLGLALALAIKSHGNLRRKYTVRVVAGRTEKARRKITRTSKQVLWALAVPAEAVQDALRSILPSVARGDVVLHTAPTLSPEALAEARTQGAAVGVLYPLARVIGRVGPWWGSPLRVSPYCFDGDVKARRAALVFVRASHGSLLAVQPEDRARSVAAYNQALATMARGLCEAVEQVQADVAGALPAKAVRSIAETILRTLRKPLNNATPHELVALFSGAPQT